MLTTISISRQASISLSDTPKATASGPLVESSQLDTAAMSIFHTMTLFALAAVAFVCAVPQEPAPAQQKPVEIVKQDSEVDVNGYNFEFETSDGTSRQEQGDYKNDTDQQGLLVKGSYKYVAPDGQHISVTYIADKNGYQPTEQGAQPQGAQPQAAQAAQPAPPARP
ncbi:hypothetical protein K1T71_004516 [Dendrolimus kikuchii]|uniref:Uncharacterized protein n=1 Tax=Dendrolimus kikuchii TaxID=765133 RepID=A0ACC1D7T4_9NEOP|nr:hypothetical protein K1T71_004516 [Dendrolimus kikuchii]